MTFEQAKDQVAKEEGYEYWTAMENSSDVSWARLLQCSEDAGKLYARSKWDEGVRDQLTLANEHCMKWHKHVLLEVPKPEFNP